MNNLIVRRITSGDDTFEVANRIRPEQWGPDNEMEAYDQTALRQFLSHDDNVLLVAYDADEIVGLLLATKIYMPYKNSHWMYVDELDTRPSHRRQGVARALMEHLFTVTKEMGMNEVWLGTEHNNTAAQKLYESLGPAEVERMIGYTYLLK